MVYSQWGQENHHELAEHLLQGHKLVAVSDGSYYLTLQIGTSLWSIQSEDGTLQTRGDNVDPGQYADQCPHRSKLSGLRGTVFHINQLCIQFDITYGKVELGCDGLAAYQAAMRYSYPPTTK